MGSGYPPTIRNAVVHTLCTSSCLHDAFCTVGPFPSVVSFCSFQIPNDRMHRRWVRFHTHVYSRVLYLIDLCGGRYYYVYEVRLFAAVDIVCNPPPCAKKLRWHNGYGVCMYAHGFCRYKAKFSPVCVVSSQVCCSEINRSHIDIITSACLALYLARQLFFL